VSRAASGLRGLTSRIEEGGSTVDHRICRQPGRTTEAARTRGENQGVNTTKTLDTVIANKSDKRDRADRQSITRQRHLNTAFLCVARRCRGVRTEGERPFERPFEQRAGRRGGCTRGTLFRGAMQIHARDDTVWHLGFSNESLSLLSLLPCAPSRRLLVLGRKALRISVVV
jgi:hypothetical protein